MKGNIMKLLKKLEPIAYAAMITILCFLLGVLSAWWVLIGIEIIARRF